jgi:hypothetical protein
MIVQNRAAKVLVILVACIAGAGIGFVAGWYGGQGIAFLETLGDNRDPAPLMQRGAARMSKVGAVVGGVGAAALVGYLLFRKR